MICLSLLNFIGAAILLRLLGVCAHHFWLHNRCLCASKLLASGSKGGVLFGCMICISLLSLVSAAALIICVPYWSRTFFQSKCTCPAVPICPDCGMPF
ncbi:hypothetical protein HW555_008250 [Spodoptera exigua]|uniref:Uncharacterized protein n=1 Tax=Spodoptera exigua TaxID=7107 RepID=A0A835GF74_SPOEX|nr:hypothetical protein HW555_008250 [Spodoptera exigua]